MATSLGAQQQPAPITLEARGGYTFPVGSFSSDVGAQSDFGYGAAVILGLSPSFGIYGGWGRDIFHCDGCGPGDEIHASGFEVGGKFTAPDRVRAHPWIKAGLLAPRSLIRWGTARFDSSRHLGFQAAVGVDAPLSDMISVSPSLRFNSFRSEFDGIEGASPPPFGSRTDFRYLSFDVSAQIHLR